MNTGELPEGALGLDGWEPVIGLEVHLQLATASKIFCACPTGFGAPPNTQVCPVCLGLPGALPVLNARAVELAVMAALALESEIQPRSIFARKHYFYPDLPKGYQISQFDLPFALGGAVTFDVVGEVQRAALTRIHLEEDAGKSLHGTGASSHHSLVDLNRAGTPLIEIVSEPVLHSSEAAVAYLKALHAVVTALGVSDGNMERGNFRCDANVSVRPRGTRALGTRVELKNLNSFRYVGRAIQYEVRRQIACLEAGEALRQQTRLWDVEHARTVSMREKEESHDYRYFPDPDLPPLLLDPGWIDWLRGSLPELPRARAQRYVRELELSAQDAGVLTSSTALSSYFEDVAAASGNPRAAAGWVMGELLGALNREGREISEAPVRPGRLAELIRRIDSGELSGRMAKRVFGEVYSRDVEPSLVIAELGLKQIVDDGALEALVEEVVAAHPAEVEQLRAGKTRVAGFLVGQVMKRSGGQAQPARVNELLQRRLARDGRD